MDAAGKNSWLARRLTFGSGFGTASGIDHENFLAPETVGAGPWVGVDVPIEISLDDAIAVVHSWLEDMATTAAPATTWLTWFWHDHFAVSATQIRALSAFTGHVDLLRTNARTDFGTLIRNVTTDPAMLVFLDGRRNRRGAINENYGRELLELYALGVGNYTEDDVRAAAVALSGWVWNQELDDSLFLARRHDPTPQTLLGERVNDVDSVLAAVTSHPACAAHLTARLGEAVLGTAVPEADATVIADRFRASGLEIDALFADLVQLALDGAAVPVVLQPVQWFLQAQAITGAEPEPRQRMFALRQMGQVPGLPPNVGGYPDALTWAGPSTTIGRFRAASLIAGLTPDHSEVLDAARRRDWERVAALCERPDGFSTESLAALGDANTTRRNGREALAAVLLTPELAVA